LIEEDSDARAFAESVAGVLGRHSAPAAAWTPGERTATSPDDDALAARLDDIGWGTLAGQPELVACAGLGAVELGRSLASIHHVDRLLGAAPLAGELIRHPDAAAAVVTGGSLLLRPVLDSSPCPSAEGLDVHRVTRLGDPAPVGEREARSRLAAWRAASVGYLAGLGDGALALTTEYVRQRRAFGTTLAGLAPVQQLLAGAATSVRGVMLLAGDNPGPDAFAHSADAIAQACGACQQVTGAVGFTLEYPLHRFTQRARALAAWNDRLLDSGLAADLS
jgi:hypothetical protein